MDIGGGKRAFVPAVPPPKISHDGKLAAPLAEAERRVGELKGKGDGLRNPYALLRSCLRREAVASPKIEGTAASIEGLNRYEELGMGKRFAERLGLREASNNAEALEWALKEIGERDRTSAWTRSGAPTEFR